MPVTARWLDEEKTILGFIYSGSWEWQEAFDMMATSPQMMDEVDHPVAVVVDMTTGQQLPSDPLKHIPKLSQGRGKSKNDSGITVFLNANILTKAMQDVIEMTKMPMPKGLVAVYARTYDDAIEQARIELQRYKDRQ